MATPTNNSTLLRRRPPGMTLIELLVSIAILSMIILIFSMILSRSQALVSTSQAAMRGNAAAAAIAETIRSDIRRVTQNGFLCITQAADKTPILIMTTAGPTDSVRSPGVGGTAAIVIYGIVKPAGSSDYILYRRSLLLTGTTADDSIEGKVPGLPHALGFTFGYPNGQHASATSKRSLMS